MKATIGRIVTVLGVSSNGATEAPGIITRAWSERDTREGAVAVNVTVFPDVAPPAALSSVMLFETREAARAWRFANTAPAAHWPEQGPPPLVAVQLQALPRAA